MVGRKHGAKLIGRVWENIGFVEGKHYERSAMSGSLCVGCHWAMHVAWG